MFSLSPSIFSVFLWISRSDFENCCKSYLFHNVEAKNHTILNTEGGHSGFKPHENTSINFFFFQTGTNHIKPSHIFAFKDVFNRFPRWYIPELRVAVAQQHRILKFCSTRSPSCLADSISCSSTPNSRATLSTSLFKRSPTTLGRLYKLPLRNRWKYLHENNKTEYTRLILPDIETKRTIGIPERPDSYMI